MISPGFGPPFGPVLQETVVLMTAIFGRSVKAYVNELHRVTDGLQ